MILTVAVPMQSRYYYVVTNKLSLFFLQTFYCIFVNSMHYLLFTIITESKTFDEQ